MCRLSAILCCAIATTCATAVHAQTHTSREFEFQNGAIKLAAELLVPQGPARGCAVVIQGSGDSDRRNAWARSIATSIAETGFIVVLPDKRGSGKSEGDWRSASFEDLARDTIAAVDQLQKEKHGCKSTGVVGLSQGGRIAPLAAALDPRIAFVVNVSGSAVLAERQLLHEIANDFRQSGLDQPSIDSLMSLVRLGIHYIRTGEGWDAYAGRRSTLNDGPLSGAVRGFPADRDDWFWSFWRKTIDFDPLPSWRELRVPAIVFYGADDELDNVPVRESVGRLTTITNRHIEIQVIDGVGHSLMTGMRLHPGFVDRLKLWLAERTQP